MKNKIFLSFILVFAFLSGYSQVQLGFKFGVNRNINKQSTVLKTSPHNINFGYINTYHFGFTGEYNLNKKLGVSAELLYAVKGTHFNKTEFVKGFDHKLSYFNLPLLLNYRFFRLFSLQSGVELGYLYNSKDNVFSNSGTMDDVDSFNRFDFSGLIGLKLNMPANVFLSLRYVHGLSSVYDIYFVNEDGLPTGKTKILNRAYQLSIGYNFR